MTSILVGTLPSSISQSDQDDENDYNNNKEHGINYDNNRNDIIDDDNDDEEEQQHSTSTLNNEQNGSSENHNDNENGNDDQQIESQSESESPSSTRSASLQSEDNDVDDNDNDTSRLPPLTSSSRLMGYFALFFLSCLAFVAAYESDGIHKLTSNLLTTNTNNNNKKLFQVVDAVPASSSGRYYALTVSGVSASSNLIIMIMHYLDGIIPLFHLSSNNNNNNNSSNHNSSCDSTTCLRKLFKPAGIIECLILLFSCIWWIVAVAIITSIRGPAGDGRNQFNLYFSTWLCCITSISMFELWLIEAGYSSVVQSIASWPNRAPGWIMIFTFTVANLFCILDLLHRHVDVKDVAPFIAEKYSKIGMEQWAWLIFVCAISFATALGFSIVELFRRSEGESSSNGGGSGRSGGSRRQQERGIEGSKGGCESQFEGISLAFLVIIWLPSVVVATTDGAASDFGNTYFFTWGSTIVVIQTFITWLQDWRKSVHEASQQLHLEYDRNKLIVNANCCGESSDNAFEGIRGSNSEDDDNGDLGNDISSGNCSFFRTDGN